eukprot:CAMPEP_0119011162 /NCGR_PEP_ID=MMETSP1176-20130426/5492_1 /TAXON_ID=265551 /ORGANISM="Synedropsis recta cf, Strain CCMP1620" /LENGTH=206 /DNA_ID=CAMNT_0006963939 /DNA_START=38 /DNA_END=655 /DNA_ORIENTATION=-
MNLWWMALSLLCLLVATTSKVNARAVKCDSNKSWNIERTWEKQPITTSSHYDDNGPWPLLVPRRTEKTVILKLTYGSKSQAHSCYPINDDNVDVDVDVDADGFDFYDDITTADLDENEQRRRRHLSGGGEEEGDEHGESLSVHVTYEDIYDTLIFLATAWVAGHIALLLGMPTLVGEIVTGFLLGPPLADYVPQPEAMVLIGEIGL